MPKYEYSESVPKNIEDLKKMAMNKTSYRTRNEAIETLKNYKCRQSIDVLWRLMINDKVYSVQHQAFLALQNFGEDVKLPRKKKGNLVKDINKKLGKVQSSFKEENCTIEEFIEKFKVMYPEEYDIYSYEKAGKMQEWIKNIVQSLPGKKEPW
nr:HEAT repeat domain-containing protein [Moraxella osloensis]